MTQGTSLADLAVVVEPHRREIMIGLLALPVVGPLIGRLLMGLSERAGAWFLSLVIHLAVFLVLPTAMILGYLGFVVHTNLFTQVDALLYIAPLLSGTFTLFMVPRVMALEDIPGFDRLVGLFVLVGVTTFLLMLFAKMRIYMGFFILGGFKDLLLVGLGIFLLLRWALGKISGSSDTGRDHLVEVEDF